MVSHHLSESKIKIIAKLLKFVEMIEFRLFVKNCVYFVTFVSSRQKISILSISGAGVVQTLWWVSQYGGNRRVHCQNRKWWERDWTSWSHRSVAGKSGKGYCLLKFNSFYYDWNADSLQC